MLRLPLWSQRLERATSIEEVLVIVRDFLARWKTEELRELGDDGRPGRMTTPVAVSEYALWLTRTEIDAGPFAPLTLHTMARFFAAANHRLAQISRSNREAQNVLEALSRLPW